MSQIFFTFSSKFSDIHDRYSTSQKEINDMNSKLQDMQYDLQKSQNQVEKLIKRINEISTAKEGTPSVPAAVTSTAKTPSGTVASNPQV